MKCAGINPQGCTNTWWHFALPKDPDTVAKLDKCLIDWQDANPNGNYSLNRNAHPSDILTWEDFGEYLRHGRFGLDLAERLAPLVGTMYWEGQDY